MREEMSTHDDLLQKIVETQYAGAVEAIAHYVGDQALGQLQEAHSLEGLMQPGVVDPEMLRRCGGYMGKPGLVFEPLGFSPREMVRMIDAKLNAVLQQNPTFARCFLDQTEFEGRGKFDDRADKGKFVPFVTDLEAKPALDPEIMRHKNEYLAPQGNGQSPRPIQAHDWLMKINRAGLGHLEGFRRYLAAQMRAIYENDPLDSGDMVTELRPSILGTVADYCHHDSSYGTWLVSERNVNLPEPPFVGRKTDRELVLGQYNTPLSKVPIVRAAWTIGETRPKFQHPALS